MAEEKQNSTIVVKKSDGTYVRMSLSEFKRVKKESLSAKTTPSSTKQITIPKTSQIINKTVNIKTTLKEKDDNQLKKEQKNTINNQSSKEDFILSLEEDLPEGVGRGAPLISESRLSQADEIIKKLNFSVSPDCIKRLCSTIQLCLKEVRSEEQTKDILVGKQSEGGVGLTLKQAEEVLNHCREKKLPALYEEAKLPATSTPFNKFKTPPLEKKISPNSSNISSSMKPADVEKKQTVFMGDSHQQNLSTVLRGTSTEENFKFSKPKVKPIVRDVVSKSVEVGPVEELGGVTLTDFRYLAPKPQEAAARLGQKFLNLKAESILLYLDGVEAWRKSPLYLDYTNVLSEALAKRKPLDSILNDKQKINSAEITALVNMEKEFIH